MAKSTLVSFANIPALKSPWFPAEYQTLLFRLWGMVSLEKLGEVLECSVEAVREELLRLGLNPDRPVNPAWRERGYITLLRDTWHTLTMEQQCTLLDITQEELDTILREDDFLWVKFGWLKPVTDGAKYRPLTEEEKSRTDEIRSLLKSFDEKIGPFPDSAFEFVNEYYKEASPLNKTYPDFKRDSLRFIYSYFALYGDPLIDERLDPFPDKLLEEYANYGVNGIWLQGVLYQLVNYPFAPELSQGFEIRQKNLKKLVDRAKRYGIGVYLYFNEPRSMPTRVFEKYPHLKGHVRNSSEASMCTSTPEVKAYLENAAYELFHAVEGLAGFFTITRSENQTNCYSHANEDDCTCTRCRERSVPEVIAEVNNLLSRGARRASPDARAIAWVWGWPDDRIEEVISRLDKNIIFQSTSETRLPLNKGGVEVEVADYTISNPGPSEWAKNNWKIAQKHSVACAAKVQFNNTWEVSGVPYIPVFDLVYRHAVNLKRFGIEHFMLSWTLGGAPSPSLKLVSGLLDGTYSEENAVREMIDELFPEGERDIILREQKVLSDAFENFPFSCPTVYNAPVTAGPRAPLYPERTGYNSSMVCFPYDCLQSWRSNYPEEIFENLMGRVVEPWEKAVEELRGFKEKNETSTLFTEFLSCAEGCLEHFATTLYLTRFVRARNALLDGEETLDGKDARMVLLTALDDEEKNTLSAIRTQSVDSRIGFEASNHYNFTRQNLMEKLINIDYVRKIYKK